MRRWAAALLLAGAATGAAGWAACAFAQAAVPFQQLSRAQPTHPSHLVAYACAGAGVGLIVASFPLADAADRRYADYLVEPDPAAIDARWRSSVRADRIASGSLLAGEALLATAVYLRFIGRPHDAHVSLEILPARCAVSCRF